jgi:hypothetical protein
VGEKAARVNHQPPSQSRLAMDLTFGYCPQKTLQYLSPPQVWSANAVVRLTTYRVVSQTPPLDHGFYYILYSGSCKVSLMSVTVAISPSLQWNHLLRVTKGAKIASAQLPVHLMLHSSSSGGIILQFIVCTDTHTGVNG